MASSSCPYGLGPYPDAAAVIYSSTVTVQEDGLPAASAPVVSGLSSGWVGPATQVSYAGSDQLGLRTVGLVEGSTAVATTTNTHCVDWSVLPCAETSAGGSVGLSGNAAAGSLTALGDGTHSLRTRALDGANNASLSGPVTVQIDTTPPVAQNLAGGGASLATARSLSWALPPGGSPITAAQVRLCTVGGAAAGCVDHAAPIAGPYGFDVPADAASVNAQVRLTDAAGNTQLTGPLQFTRAGFTPTPFDAPTPGPGPTATPVPVATPTPTAGPGGPIALPAPGLSLRSSTGPRRTFAIDRHGVAASTLLTRLCRGTTCTLASRSFTDTYTATLPAYGSWQLQAAVQDSLGAISPYASVSFTFSAKSKKLAAKLTATFPKRLPRSTFTLRGTTVVDGTGKVTVTLMGRTARGKSVSTHGSAQPSSKTGRWSIRVKIPKGANRRTGVLVTIAAKPSPGFSSKTVRKRLRTRPGRSSVVFSAVSSGLPPHVG